MDMEQFAAEMERRGCTRIPDTQVFCGTCENYPFLVRYMSGKPGGKTGYAVHMQFVEKVPRSKLLKELAPLVKGQASIGFLAAGDKALLLMNVTVPREAEVTAVFDTLMAHLIGALPRYGLHIPGTCPVCKQPGCDSYAFIDGTFRPVHAACIQNKTAAELEKVADNEVNGNYATGILGAVLGAIVGTIPNVLLIFFAGRIYAVLCALIPLAAYYGYKWLRGRMTKAVMPIVIVISVLMTPVMDFLTELAFMLAEGYYITPLDYIQAFIMYPGEFTGPLLQILLFIGLGILVVSGLIRRNNTHVSTQAVSTLASLRPMAGATAPRPVAQPAAPQPIAPAAPQPMAPPAAQPGAPVQPQPPAAPPAPPTPPTEG